MERSGERDLEILTAIAEGRPLTQRALAARVGIALGLANLYLNRLARKGYIKVAQFPRKPAARKRLHYLLTAKGIKEKSRLTYEHIVYSLGLYRRTRETLRGSMESLVRQGAKRMVLYGAEEAAELAYLTLKEFGLEPVGVVARVGGGSFLGFPVQDVDELLTTEFDAIIVATFDRPEPEIDRLVALGFAREKFVTLRRLATADAVR